MRQLLAARRRRLGPNTTDLRVSSGVTRRDDQREACDGRREQEPGGGGQAGAPGPALLGRSEQPLDAGDGGGPAAASAAGRVPALARMTSALARWSRPWRRAAASSAAISASTLSSGPAWANSGTRGNARASAAVTASIRWWRQRRWARS